MANIINKFFKKIANNGNDGDYELVGEIGVNGIPLEEYLDQRFQSMLGEMYPVGSIYFSVKNENPSSKFGGTWVAWGSGRVPVGVNSSDGNFNSVEKTGGASTVTLTTAQIPKHTHSVSGYTNSTGSHAHIENDLLWANEKSTTGGSSDKHQVVRGGAGGVWLTCRTQGGGMRAELQTLRTGLHSHTFSCTSESSGSGNSHTNLQPYITCYMWKRTK